MDESELRRRIVASARSWIGTRFRHQGRSKKTANNIGGVDCLGLLVGVADELGLRHEGQILAAQDRRDYGHFPNEARLRANLERWLTPVEEFSDGNMLLLSVDGRAQHLAIVSDHALGGFGMIHAYAPARQVIEHRLDTMWKSSIVASYAFDSI